jgi:hypothetical protein
MGRLDSAKAKVILLKSYTKIDCVHAAIWRGNIVAYTGI